jgi:hypothetical protein
VADQHAPLLALEQAERAAVQHDERPLEAHGHRVHERRLRHEQLGALALVIERLEHLRVERVELRALPRAHAHRVGSEEEPHAALADEPHHLAHHLIESRDRAQRLQRRPVRRMLPRRGRDIGEYDSLRVLRHRQLRN